MKYANFCIFFTIFGLYYDFWVEFVVCFCVKTYFPLSYVCIYFSKKEKKKEGYY